ncbi:sugar transferase [Winogradskyella vidalii]|uniref:sugar transferase n=1 Tax=Winogradskyella vidalii TaxID=2615024 RepID=UPI0015C8858F|nr:sugar transferase [Winogradskyella vidalii]
MISTTQLRIKRIFDVILVLLLLPLLITPIILLILIATIDTQQWGVFSQCRVGQYGKLFKIYKIRTLKDSIHPTRAIVTKMSSIGKYLSKSKLNEWPQLFNVLLGDMSFVGPRPDLKGFADELKGEDRIILKVKPGITGPATLKYKNEESILAKQKDPVFYNRTIIWVDKVKINKNYVQNYSFYLDLILILKSTILK